MNEIDVIMNLDPLELSEQDVDKIIKYERAQRLAHELGVKPKKEKGQSISLENVLASLLPGNQPKPEPTLKRRI